MTYKILPVFRHEDYKDSPDYYSVIIPYLENLSIQLAFVLLTFLLCNLIEANKKDKLILILDEELEVFIKNQLVVLETNLDAIRINKNGIKYPEILQKVTIKDLHTIFQIYINVPVGDLLKHLDLIKLRKTLIVIKRKYPHLNYNTLKKWEKLKLDAGAIFMIRQTDTEKLNNILCVFLLAFYRKYYPREFDIDLIKYKMFCFQFFNILKTLFSKGHY